MDGGGIMPNMSRIWENVADNLSDYESTHKKKGEKMDVAKIRATTEKSRKVILPETIMNYYLGVTESSNSTEVYFHDKTCPWCGVGNSGDRYFCTQCGGAL